MKNKILKIGMLALAIVAVTSCQQILEQVISKEIPIKNQSVTFTVEPGTRADEGEETLFDGVLEINIAEEIEKKGFSFDKILSLALKTGTLELVTPSNYNMDGFLSAKLYFDNKKNLVATAEKVEHNKVLFTVVNVNLLDKLRDDSLHIILTGQRPPKKVILKLIMDYAARVTLISSDT
ncbi:MAG: hypothetical protein GX125_08515 [Bacteroidales bacterium]|jgi:hypothetical protein|nr:hypothetical protein [Bacteroidota bacterium]NLO00286.1 hypothetical protein [Bacteroidales bacterium]